ncbi:MAG: hypothetical protein LBK94_09110 [Prevotellaceae bacterium]|nr:hypothetical protein [Prevotellaceae bacterium]
MKRKIKITVGLLFLFMSYNAGAQQTIMQKLINKIWVLSWDNENDNYAYKQQYTSTQITKSVITNFGTTSVVADFYLSNQVETTFNYSKVGNATDGKYIISFLPEMDGESYFMCMK